MGVYSLSTSYFSSERLRYMEQCETNIRAAWRVDREQQRRPGRQVSHSYKLVCHIHVIRDLQLFDRSEKCMNKRGLSFFFIRGSNVEQVDKEAVDVWTASSPTSMNKSRQHYNFSFRYPGRVWALAVLPEKPDNVTSGWLSSLEHCPRPVFVPVLSRTCGILILLLTTSHLLLLLVCHSHLLSSLLSHTTSLFTLIHVFAFTSCQ